MKRVIDLRQTPPASRATPHEEGASTHGLVGFHDIVQHPPETGCEVQAFWEELKGRYAHDEIVANHEQVWGGIGVIEVGGIGSD